MVPYIRGEGSIVRHQQTEEQRVGLEECHRTTVLTTAVRIRQSVRVLFFGKRQSTGLQSSRSCSVCGLAVHEGLRRLRSCAAGTAARGLSPDIFSSARARRRATLRRACTGPAAHSSHGGAMPKVERSSLRRPSRPVSTIPKLAREGCVDAIGGADARATREGDGRREARAQRGTGPNAELEAGR